jgi:hypothetical protein
MEKTISVEQQVERGEIFPCKSVLRIGVDLSSVDNQWKYIIMD